ncbi:MAG: hypothetical protein JWO19_896 [Bryobacterales bacterium]|nr:hypothetical protein [Bryobacterales bacterium]
MLAGKRFRLSRSTLALDVLAGKRVAVTVPAGCIVQVASGPLNKFDRMIDVLWEDRNVVMFAIDVDVPGTEITEQSAKA